MVFGLEGGHEVSFRWAEINNERITLSFRPATPVDEQALMALLPEGEITDISQLPGSIPTYLVNLVPELKVGDDVVLTGDRIRPGEEVTFTYTPYLAGGRIGGTNPYKVIAGSYLAVAAIAGNVAPSALDNARVALEAVHAAIATDNLTDISKYSKEALLGNLFYIGVLGYYSQLIAYARIAGLSHAGHHYLGSGLGTFGYEPDIHTVLGLPMSINRGAAVMNIPILNIFGLDSESGAEWTHKKVDYALQVGVVSSILEHVVPESLLYGNPNAMKGASMVRALLVANDTAQRIFRLTRENGAIVLPTMHHNALVKSEIQASLLAGLHVITHESPVIVGSWQGTGYLIFDAETGGGAYKISGGFSGDETEIEDHSLKMFLAISVGVIGTVAALHISLLFGFAILLAFAIDYAALWWTISKADRAADNDEINQAIAVMFIVGFAGFLPLWAVAELEGVGLVLYGFMAWFATLFSLGAF